MLYFYLTSLLPVVLIAGVMLNIHSHPYSGTRERIGERKKKKKKVKPKGRNNVLTGQKKNAQ